MIEFSPGNADDSVFFSGRIRRALSTMSRELVP